MKTKLFAPKEIVLKSGVIFFHYANNAGRGNDNVTVTFCKPGTSRPMYTRMFKKDDIIGQTRTFGWRGIVDFPESVQKRIGIENQ